jgi:hypothetical protein
MRRPSDSSLTSKLPRWGGEVVSLTPEKARQLEKAHQKLIDELAEVRRRFDAANKAHQKLIDELGVSTLRMMTGNTLC